VGISAQVYLQSNYILTYILAGVFKFPTREFKTPEKILESSLQISRWLTHSSHHPYGPLNFLHAGRWGFVWPGVATFFAGCLLSSCPSVQIGDDATLSF
jgi:hypothetical protein